MRSSISLGSRVCRVWQTVSDRACIVARWSAGCVPGDEKAGWDLEEGANDPQGGRRFRLRAPGGAPCVRDQVQPGACLASLRRLVFPPSLSLSRAATLTLFLASRTDASWRRRSSVGWGCRSLGVCVCVCVCVCVGMVRAAAFTVISTGGMRGVVLTVVLTSASTASAGSAASPR